MSYIRDFEGAGRIRLDKGQRMSYASFRETMREMFPDSQEAKKPLDGTNDSYDYLDDVIEDVQKLTAKVSRIEKSMYLKRAERDIQSGRLHTETDTQITHHPSERDIWN